MSNTIAKQQDAAAIVQGKWNKLYQAENKAWSGAWPKEHESAYLQFVAGVRALVNKEPRLLECPDFTIRLIECAGLGLLPHFGPRGEAIIMYANSQKYGPQASLIVGYKGYEAAWYRDGIIVPGRLKVEARMKDDVWEYEENAEGSHFRWSPNYSKPRTYDNMMLVFARAVLREGGMAIGIRDRAKCDEVSQWAQNRGQGGPAYKAWPLEMAKKGAVMELKRELPFGQNTERLLEYEVEREEKDMGTAQRVDLSQAQPITVSLPAATRIPEVVEPTAEPAKVETQSATETKKGRIVDESTTPDATPAGWTDEDEDKLSQWENSEGPVPEGVYFAMAAVVQRLPKDATRTKLAERVKALKPRVVKQSAEVQREPGAEG